MRVGLFFGSFDPPHIGHVNVVMGAINSSQVGRDTKVKVVLDSAYTEVGQTGKIYHTDYRSALPYEVIMDKGDCVWVAGCTIQNVDTEVYIEEYSADVENEVSPDEDILENGFSRQVTFYEKD